MIGDLIIWFRKVWKENFCVHDYELKKMNVGLGYKFYNECRKCGRVK
jgi:hypothetical protein